MGDEPPAKRPVVTEAEDLVFMEAAFVAAREALDVGEVPVGCVLVREGRIMARGHNLVNTCMDATRHAELVAVDRLLRSWPQQACAPGPCSKR